MNLLRKLTALLVAVSMTLTLFGCAQYPSKALDGTTWDKRWEMLGKVLGVEAPADGLTLLANDTILSADDTHYATWTIGEPTKYTNEDNKEVDLYPAQMYLLVYGCADTESTQEAYDDWMERTKDTYDIQSENTNRYNGQEYNVLHYLCISETNPYERGVAAFGIFEHYVVIAEFSCTEGFDGDETEIMERFLEGCHYSNA